MNGEAITAKDRAQGTALFGLVKQMRAQASSSITNGARLAKSAQLENQRSSRSSSRKQSLSDLYEEGRGGGKSSLWSGVKSQVGKQDSNTKKGVYLGSDDRSARARAAAQIALWTPLTQKWINLTTSLVKIRRAVLCGD